jgi:spore coat polysaccharide biosynthesis predicted glycosyltransferase SpsG
MKVIPNMLFRCDQNYKSGFGHFSRCLNLARHLSLFNNVNVTFLGNYSDFSKSLLNNYKLKHLEVSELEFENVHEDIIGKYSHIVLDSYFITQTYLDKVCVLDVKTIFIDDTCILDFSGVDLVINFRVGAEVMFSYKSRYEALGEQYFIYKPEFERLRENATFNSRVKKVLLFFGGINLEVSFYVEIVNLIKEIDSNIVVFLISDKLELVMDNVVLLKPTFEIENYLEDIDVIINGGGLMKYEGVFCKIPSVTFSNTELQYEDTVVLESKNVVYNLGFIENVFENKGFLKKKLLRFVNEPKLRYEIFKKSGTIFNINSIDNIVKKIKKI